MALVDGKADFLLAAQLQLEALFPGSVDFGAGSLVCARSGEVYDDEAEPGGYHLDESVSIRVRTSLLPTKPDLGDTCTLDSRTLRVERVTLESDDVAWNIELREP